jgi:hypothetical protein
MKRIILGLFWSFLLLSPSTVYPLSVSISDKGALIDAGILGAINLPPPLLDTPDKKGLKPTYTRETDHKATAAYPNGFVLQIETSDLDNSINYSYKQAPLSGTVLRFVTIFPMNLNQGGKFALGKNTGVFPAEKAGQFVAQGTAEYFDVIHPLGEGIRISTLTNYQQIVDNRTWSWNAFSWVYHYDLKRYSSEKTFSFKITSTQNKEVTAGGDTPKFLVDRFGQSSLKNYPGKVYAEDELKNDISKQKLTLTAYNGPPLDRFGGLAGSGTKLGLKKTGFFYTTEIQKDRHVFVTPEGNIFFQLAVGINNTDDFTLVKGREKTYEWLPDPKDPLWIGAWRGQNPSAGVFSFQIANWIRKYGKPYSFEEWTGQTVERLRAWGFNSAGAFSASTQTMRELNFPGVTGLPNGRPHGVTCLPDKIGAAELMDPFAPGAEEAFDKACAKSVAPRASDPLLIGYFLGNEQHFENLPKLVPSYKASKVPAKAKLMELLRSKYGDVGNFNKAWRPTEPFVSFDQAAESPLFIQTDAAAADMRIFLQLYLDTYYSMMRRVFKKHDANHLLIGSRLTRHTAINEDVIRISAKYVDVISINYYTYGVEKDFLKKVYEMSGGRPLLLSEWYYSSTEEGLGGGKEVKNQTERGLAYRNYIEQTASTGYVIGSQWFMCSDQSITGRWFSGFNGEGNNTGFIDVVDRPYEPLVQAARLTHSHIYDVILGNKQAFAFDDVRFSGKGADTAKVVAIPPAEADLKFNASTTGWPGRPAEPIGPNQLAVGNANPKLGGDFRLCWNKEALHFLIQVKDPTPGKNAQQPKRYWDGDAVELFIGSRNLSEGGNPQFSDRHLLIGVGPTPGVYIIDHPESGKACRVIVSKEITGDGYTLQLQIPWEVLDLQPKAGTELLFDVAIDNSDDGKIRLQQLVWSGASKNSGDRGSWGRARLVDN